MSSKNIVLLLLFTFSLTLAEGKNHSFLPYEEVRVINNDFSYYKDDSKDFLPVDSILKLDFESPTPTSFGYTS